MLLLAYYISIIIYVFLKLHNFIILNIFIIFIPSCSMLIFSKSKSYKHASDSNRELREWLSRIVRDNLDSLISLRRATTVSIVRYSQLSQLGMWDLCLIFIYRSHDIFHVARANNRRANSWIAPRRGAPVHVAVVRWHEIP